MNDDDDQLNKTAPIPPVINDDGEQAAEGGGEPVDIDEQMHDVGLTTDDMNTGGNQLNIAKQIDKAEEDQRTH